MKPLELPDPNSDILPIHQIVLLSDEEIFSRIRLRVRQAKRAFIEIGKLIFVLKSRHGEDFKPYTVLGDKFDNSCLSNASYGAKVWQHYVAEEFITELQFEELTFKQCLELDRARRDGVQPAIALRQCSLSIRRGNDASIRGANFERYVLTLLKTKYEIFEWTSPGALKRQERGLDFIGSMHDPNTGVIRRLGVQVKYHEENATPSEKEWLQFLAGCYVQRITEALFITTGRLSADQLREAGEAGIHVIEGRGEITKLARRYNLPPCPSD